jgi:restriction system protein
MRNGWFHRETAPETNEEDSTVHGVVEEIENLTRDFILRRLSQELKGHLFAESVAHLLQAVGYRIRVSAQGPDGGVDIIAHRYELGFEPPIIKVQVKSMDGNIGRPTIASLLNTLGTGECGLIVTLGGLTAEARTFARGKGNLRLIDSEDLANLVLSHYEQFDASYTSVWQVESA